MVSFGVFEFLGSLPTPLIGAALLLAVIGVIHTCELASEIMLLLMRRARHHVHSLLRSKTRWSMELRTWKHMIKRFFG